MMDHLELARKRYEAIRSECPERPDGMRRKELSTWLRADVGRVVEPLVDRPDFRAHARFPMDRLQKGAKSEERQLVQAVDQALVRSAQRLAEVARQRQVRNALLRLGPWNEQLPLERPRPKRGAARRSSTRSPIGLGAVEFVATRPWHDLVASIDYFGPAANLNLVDPVQYLGPDWQTVSLGEFLPYLNPQMRRPGDFVTRSMLTRVDHWIGVVRQFTVRCQTARQNAEIDGGQAWKRLEVQLTRLGESRARLEHLCCGGDAAAMREACMALLQVFVAYRPQPALGWLQLPPQYFSKAATFRYLVESRGDLEVTDCVAAALANVAPLFHRDLDVSDLITLAKDRCALVVVTGPGRREIHWRGKLVKSDWDGRDKQWQLVVALARSAMYGRGSGIDPNNFDSGSERTRAGKSISTSLKDLVYRLNKDRLLPDELLLKIEPAGGGKYRLDLTADQCELIELEVIERPVKKRRPK